jgi:glycosyltransferase involved in cell wall biosynthesis
MRAADGFLMSSAWEGLPMALLEAGASGLPIVATDVGGTSDAILDGVSGRVVPAGDPAALAAAMEQVMSLSPDALAAMGQAGRDHVARTFELGAIADRWDAIYRGLLERKTRSG